VQVQNPILRTFEGDKENFDVTYVKNTEIGVIYDVKSCIGSGKACSCVYNCMIVSYTLKEIICSATESYFQAWK